MTAALINGAFVEYPAVFPRNSLAVSGNTVTIDAAGEIVHMVGYCMLEDPAGGSKTISSAGGKIHWFSGSSTVFSNASTTVRIGIQDVSTTTSPSQGDATFDVYDDLIGGTDTIASTAAQVTTMSSGTKSLSHGQLIAIVFNMTARGGTDAVKILTYSPQNSASNAPHLPSVILETSGPTYARSSPPTAVIEFDDGTYGWIMGSTHIGANQSSAAFNSGTGTADEYGNLIAVKHDIVAQGISVELTPANASADFELCLYSDPLGTPAIIEAITIDATQLGSGTANGYLMASFSTPRTLDAGTSYAITVRPTTANNVTVGYIDVTAAKMWRVNGLDEDTYAVRRLDNTGAFSDYYTGTVKTRRMNMGLLVSKFDDGAGAGGGLLTHPSMSGGMRG